jgi:hypothetical protein
MERSAIQNKNRLHPLRHYSTRMTENRKSDVVDLKSFTFFRYKLSPNGVRFL